MSTYARPAAGVVFEIIQVTSAAVGTLYPAAFVATLVDVTALSPQPQPGWAATQTAGVWTFAPPPAASAPTLAQQAQAALTAGLTLTLGGSLTLAATLFPTDMATQSKLAAVTTMLNTAGVFPGGATTYPLKDAASVWHTLTVNQYKTVVGGIATYVAALFLIIDGNPLSATALPSASATLTLP